MQDGGWDDNLGFGRSKSSRNSACGCLYCRRISVRPSLEGNFRIDHLKGRRLLQRTATGQSRAKSRSHRPKVTWRH